MEIRAFSTNGLPERKTDEGCYIREISNSEGDQEVSIARARVEPGVTTARHRLRGTIERYLIIEGSGLVEVGDHLAARVSAGDVVWIPQDTTQRISNTGTSDLVFLCISQSSGSDPNATNQRSKEVYVFSAGSWPPRGGRERSGLGLSHRFPGGIFCGRHVLCQVERRRTRSGVPRVPQAVLRHQAHHSGVVCLACPSRETGAQGPAGRRTVLAERVRRVVCHHQARAVAPS